MTRYFWQNPVLQLPETLVVSGRRYVLSDWFPLIQTADDETVDDSEAEEQETELRRGARVIMGPAKKRYLWAYDMGRQTVAMWRVSDGDEKAYGDVSHYQGDMAALIERDQLNRVTSDQFDDLDEFFVRRCEQTTRELAELAEQYTTQLEERARVILNEYFDRTLMPEIRSKWTEVDQGIYPFNFRYRPEEMGGKSKKEMARRHVFSEVTGRRFTQNDAYEIVGKALGFDPYDPPGRQDPQAVQWAWNHVFESQWRKAFPL